MPILDLLDRGGREFHHWSRPDYRHLGEGDFDTEASPYSSESVEELRRQMVSTSRGVVRFSKRGKLTLRCPFEILERVAIVKY